MKLDPGYQAYVAALTAAHDLPRVQAAELDAIERRARNEIEALDRSRREAADRWVGLRDNSARLARRVDELAGRVGAPPPLGAAGDLLPPAALRGALGTLSSELDRADQSWRWLLRHQERVATTPPPPPVAPTPSYTPPPQPVPTPSPAKSNTTLLLVIGGAVILVLIVVIIVMAL